MPFYFAYGSNMDYSQMISRCPDSKLMGKAILQDHKIAFTRFSSKWDSAVADILVSPGDSVWGILYEVSEDDLRKLDKYEGHPYIYIRKKHIVLKVASEYNIEQLNSSTRNEFTSFETEVYEVVKKDLSLKPKLNYLRPILDAAFYYNFPNTYQRLLYKFGNIDYEEKLSKIIDLFLDLDIAIRNEKLKVNYKTQQEWAGANLVITESLERKEDLNKNYPQDLVIVSKYSRELSYLLERIYNDENIIWQIDSTNKYYLLSEIGNDILHYQSKNKDSKTYKEICLTMLHTAYRIITSEFYETY